MDWFLYNNVLRHERVNRPNLSFIAGTKIEVIERVTDKKLIVNCSLQQTKK